MSLSQPLCPQQLATVYHSDKLDTKLVSNEQIRFAECIDRECLAQTQLRLMF